jgi:hypothetical protein
MEKKLIWCLPGNQFSSRIMEQAIKFLYWLMENNWSVFLSVEGGSNVSTVREYCLGTTVEDLIHANHHAPFYGKVDYDYILWTDSDIVFMPEDFQRLIDDNKEIISGLYKAPKNDWYVAVRQPKGAVFSPLSEDDVKDLTDPFEAVAFGFGFVLIKKGVFEKIRRPWFLTTTTLYNGIVRCWGEDYYFCMRAIESGFKLWIDPLVKVGHIKPKTLI